MGNVEHVAGIPARDEDRGTSLRHEIQPIQSIVARASQSSVTRQAEDDWSRVGAGHVVPPRESVRGVHRAMIEPAAIAAEEELFTLRNLNTHQDYLDALSTAGLGPPP